MSFTFNSVRHAAALLLLIVSAPSWPFSQLQASVDQNPVILGQSFQLQLVADANVDGQPDLTVLERDFSVYRTNVSRSTQIINFDRTTQTVWNITLLPKRAGQLTIPALELDGIRSQPIALQAVAEPQQAGQIQPAQLQIELNNQQLWLGQPAVLTVKLLLAADLQRGSLNPPQHPDVDIQQLGQDQSTTEVIDGRRMQVIVRQYALQPQRSGQIDLGSVNFEGDLRMQGGNSFFNGARLRTVAVASDPIVLTVKPQPDSYQGQWLAADLVTLQAEEFANQQFEVGQPITLNMRLTAVGTTAESLPDLALKQLGDFRAYPDKPQREGGTQAGQLVARLIQSVALVPQHAGTLTIPEISVPWWNVRTNQQEWATLPAQTIEVAPSSSAAAPLAPAVTVVSAEPTAAPRLWQGLTALFALLWLLTLYWGWRRGKPSSRVDIAAPKPMSDRSALLSQLLNACQQNDASTVLNLLPRWASEQHGQVIDLAQLKQLQPQLSAEIDQLQQQCFGQQRGAWQGATLAQLLGQCRWQQPQAAALAALNPL
ncbi:BatD family protein [Ferrimonas senticii]|uniref:BatD family protein n=1 Tax=Ferrimonas senticii TaxID=394566 RepID=UPI0004040C5B|nr:BatD family protein [Ferrimonas senticii]